MKQQLSFFRQDIRRVLGKHRSRILFIWMSRTFWGILLYRWERGLFLTFGSSYSRLRILFTPFIFAIQAYSNCDLNYKAEIGPGLLILHPAVGVVISGYARIGRKLTLTGGNVIGLRPPADNGRIEIGNNCDIGANAVVLGPLILGDNVTIGALAAVVKDAPDNVTLLGVPAKPFHPKSE